MGIGQYCVLDDHWLDLWDFLYPNWFIFDYLDQSLNSPGDLRFVLKLPVTNWPRLTNSCHGVCPASCALSLGLQSTSTLSFPSLWETH